MNGTASYSPIRVYLAGPMTGYPLFNFPAFEAATSWLRTEGHTVVSPAELDTERGFDPARSLEAQGFDWTEVMERDLRALVTCQAIAFLSGSCESSGALAEYEVARALGLRVFVLAQHPGDDDGYCLVETTFEALDVWFLEPHTNELTPENIEVLARR